MNPAGTKLVPLAYQSSRALEELMALVAVVEADGFSAAARATRGRQATLSRRVRDLEARLGVALLVRTTRSVRLTDEGRAYFAHASRSLAAARDAEARAAAAERRARELATLVCGEPRRLTRAELAALRDAGPTGPAVMANALRALHRARAAG
ncbi:MAG TPA: LysR family transcriptional regulator, partial [Polyangiaceae bacterium]|nr:LysR family transcriptional regulator [Polyangiaceae bacterium]